MNIDNNNIIEKENKLIFNTKDCISVNSLKEYNLIRIFNMLSRGSITNYDFKRILNIDGMLNEDKLLSLNESNINNVSVKGNKILFKFKEKIKFVKSIDIKLELPEDIIPLNILIPDFVKKSLKTEYDIITDQGSSIDSPIPASKEDYYSLLKTPLRYWRTYSGKYSMQNIYSVEKGTWCPPQNEWPFQPKPKTCQNCPTYKARNGVIFSGYGLYDLEDFPEFQEIMFSDGNRIKIPLRKLILKTLVPKGQFINGLSAEYIIDKSITKDKTIDPLKNTGYGDYQRFIPGPGLGMKYQPNKHRKGKPLPIKLNISTYDKKTGKLGPMPVPFPNFTKNCWVDIKYKSLIKTIDELYMNGDLENLDGEPVLYNEYEPSELEYTFSMFIKNKIKHEVNLETFEFASNPNIKNAMSSSFIKNLKLYKEKLLKILPKKETRVFVKQINSNLSSDNHNYKFHTPLASLNEIELEFFVDNIPLSIEKCLNFSKKIKDTCIVYSNPISKPFSFIQPFTETESSDKMFTSCSAIVTKFDGNFDTTPKLENFVTKNIKMFLNISSYQAKNFKLTELMPNNLEESKENTKFKDKHGNIVNFLPMASNIDNYSR